MPKDKITEKHLATSRRHLPHWQIGGSWYFVTFRIKEGILDPEMRNTVAEAVVYGHGGKHALAIAVVMPDHVHLLLRPRMKTGEEFYSLREILKPVKGISAIQINRMRGTKGAVWQSESFDRIVREADEWREKYDYIRNNAVKAGLAERPEAYPWLIDREDFIKHW